MSPFLQLKPFDAPYFSLHFSFLSAQIQQSRRRFLLCYQIDIILSNTNYCHDFIYKCIVLFKNGSPKKALPFLARSFFWWVMPLIYRGYKEVLSAKNLPKLDREHSCVKIAPEFEAYWQQEVSTCHKYYSFLRFRNFMPILNQIHRIYQT